MTNIKYIKGDLFNTPDTVILHGCNAQGVMGSGVAKQIREKYPESFRDYLESRLVLGRVIWSQSNGKVIGNCITQQFYGRNKNTVYCDYNAIRDCMNKVNSFCKGTGVKSVSMPKIGAGLANGDWNIIEEILETEFKDVQVNVYYI